MTISILAISDTHCLEPDLQPADILIHAGDLTIRGFRSEVYKQLCWLEKEMCKFKHVILVPGNHDFYFERRMNEAKKECESLGIHLLIHERLELEGFKFFGSPYTPEYHDWAFNLKDDIRVRRWNEIPDDTEILITHGPEKGILDNGVGDFCLGSRIVRLQHLRCHIFGHIHEHGGEIMLHNSSCSMNVAYNDQKDNCHKAGCRFSISS